MKKILFSFSLVFILSLLISAPNAFADSEKEKSAGEEHRNKVSKIVEKLEDIGDDDSGIKDEVKNVAKEEKEASEKVKEKMNAVENRSSLKTFFLGSDYKNLGALRSELVITENHLNRLNRALDKAASSSKAELETQIKDLSEIKSKAEAFAKEMESKFSLFGWLVKMFK